MKGWKTWAAGLGMILSGLGLGLKMLVDGDFSEIDKVIGLVTGGLAVIGLGHKLEKGAQSN